MRKPTLLRDYLQARVPDLAAHPDHLHVFVEKGHIASGLPDLHFRYNYSVTLIITDFSGDPDGLMVPLLAWIAENQPDLLQHPERQNKAIAFEAELLGNDLADVQISMDLTERVIVTRTPTGWSTDHPAEPPFPDLTGPTGWDMPGFA